jgi:hypothetical protein
MARLPSIARSIQEMCKDQASILRQKQLTAGVDGLSDKEVAQLEILARVNAINIKADPQVKPKYDKDDPASVPPEKARTAFATLDGLAPTRAATDEEDEAE